MAEIIIDGCSRTDRPGIGKSIIALPLDYVVVDTETTGLSFDWDEIIEVAAERYEGGELAASFSSLIKPSCEVSPFIVNLTGITNEMLRDAPSASEVMPTVRALAGGLPIIGHNASFDIKFLYDAGNREGLSPLGNDFIDTVRIARKVFPELPHHRLADVAGACGVTQDTAHRAAGDVSTTAACYRYMRDAILSEMSENEFKNKFNKHYNAVSMTDYISGLSDVPAPEDSPIIGKTVVFTGTLEHMTRKEALALVKQFGGVPADSLTKATNILVVGNTDFISGIKEGRTGKMKKAEDYAARGADISIISENAFFDMIDLKV
jgi:DNA polymerase-3 subunit epsilon